MVTKAPKPRGRPRTFDAEEGLEIAQRLFEAHGYGAVSVADLTAAIGINPPSFYAAYGSKAALFERVLTRYAASGVPVKAILTPGRPVAEALSEVLADAARRYARDAPQLGCLVIEATRSDDDAVRCAAAALSQATADAIHAFVARAQPKVADEITDYMVTMMIGLSAMARAGTTPNRLLSIARSASLALSAMVPGEPETAARAGPRPALTRESTRRR